MRVQFAKNFFGPDMRTYLKDTPYEVKDEWENILPRGAKVLEDEAPAADTSGVEKESAKAGAKAAAKSKAPDATVNL